MMFGKYAGTIPQGEIEPVVVHFGTVTRLEFWDKTKPEPRFIMAGGMEIEEVERLIVSLKGALDFAKQIHAAMYGSNRQNL